MIADGYTEYRELHGFHFAYRPLLAHQRAAIKAEWEPWPDSLVERAIFRIIAEQVVHADWEQIPDEHLTDIWRVVTGTGNDQQEKRDAENLAKGARLHLEYPHLARTTCQQCRHWFYNPLEQRVARDHAGTPLKRPPSGMVLCQTPIPCPKGHFTAPLEFSPKNKQAFRHWLTCRAGPPDDEIVRRNWTILNAVEEELRNKRDRTRRHREHPTTHGRPVGRGAGRTALHPLYV